MKTILFVENDPVVVTMYRNKLQSEGFRIETAEDGLEALKVLAGITPDLVILDLMLPKLSGADVLRFIRAEPRLKHIPIVLFSNAYMTELGEDAVLASANKRLLKAYATPASLLTSIHELLAAAPAEAVAKTDAAPPTAEAIAPNPTFAAGPEQAVKANGTVTADSPQAATQESLAQPDRQEFLKQVRIDSVSLHEHCRSYVKAPASKEGQQHLSKLHEVVRQLCTNSSRTDCTHIASLMKAFDALITEVIAKPAWASPSVLQTIAQACDCLDLMAKREEAGATVFAAGKVLVVDDDLVCNRVMVSSLKRANLEPMSVQEPKEGLQLLQNNQFDAILLDVNMPEMTGFELCEQLRRLSHCKTTPVIFVTAYSNFQNRTQGVLSGGDDFITKPVSPLELALKVTIHMLKANAQRGNAPAPEIKPPSAELSPGVLQSLASAQVARFKESEAGGLPPSTVSAPVTGSSASTDPAPPTLPPPLPTQSAPTGIPPTVATPAPPAPFVAATETATSTGETPAPNELPQAPAEVSVGSLQPVASPVTDFDRSGPQNSGLKSAPIADTAPDAAGAIEQAFAPAAAPGFDPIPLAQNPDPTGALLPTTESQNSLIELTPIPNPTPPPLSESSIDDLFAEALQDAAENQVAPDHDFEPVNPAAPETQVSAAELSGAGLAAISPTSQPPQQFQTPPTSANVVAESPVAAAEFQANPPPQPPEIQPVTQNVFVESPEPAAELQTSPPPIAEADQPAAPEAPTPATELPGSVAVGNASPDAAAAAAGDLSPTGSGVEPVQPSTDPLPDPVSSGSIAAQAGLRQMSAQTSDADRIFDRIVQIVSRMVYGDQNVTPMNLRMVRVALEHYKVDELIRAGKVPDGPASDTPD